MDSKKFIKELRDSLIEGGIDRKEVNDTINYYEGYFNEKMCQGHTLEQILDELGDPRLIAKTIINISDNSNTKGKFKKRENESFHYSEHKSRRSSFTRKPMGMFKEFNTGAGTGTKIYAIKNRLISTLLLIVVIGIVVIGFIFALKIVFALLPFILVFGLIYYLLN